MHRVLVIDDQSFVRAALRISLEQLGLSVEEAENGEEGLRKARENIPDLILCDLDMPVMDGCETLEHLRNDPILSGVPVIVVSGMMTAESERWVIRAGARAVLTKPFSLDALTSLVRRYLNTGEAGQV
jgi:two-component system cell cycle response regulator DivK